MFTIQRASKDDFSNLLSLINALADYEQLPRPDIAAVDRLFYDGFVRTPPRFDAYLIKKAGEALGYTIVLETYSSFLAKPTLYIEDLFILPHARGIGAGRTLFLFLAQTALARGCGRMEWVCLNWNQLAIDFYEQHGAEHLAEWRRIALPNKN